MSIVMQNVSESKKKKSVNYVQASCMHSKAFSFTFRLEV